MNSTNCGMNDAAFCKNHPGICDNCRRVATESRTQGVISYQVTAVAMDRITRRAVSDPRVEVIDTRTNALFTTCLNPYEIELRYEAFWNELNPYSEHVVKVISVDEVGL
jgi:hypothetical protein